MSVPATRGLAHGERPEWLETDLGRVEALLVRTASESTPPLVAEAATHLIRAGGKRLRPMLVVTAGRCATPSYATDLAAAAVELVHLASLYHDDVIDETETRRGVPTVHTRWGTNVAVLAGDFLFASGCLLGAEAGGSVPGILAEALRKLCQGQILEAQEAGLHTRSVDDYFRTIGLKTAALFAAACDLGAVTSGATESERAALTRFGELLGTAFQVIDDLLDFVGDTAVTGKEAGTDWREGIFTLPVVLARDAGHDLAALGDKSLDDVIAVLDESGALRATRREAERLVAAAHESLEALPAGACRDVLHDLAGATLAQLD